MTDGKKTYKREGVARIRRAFCIAFEINVIFFDFCYFFWEMILTFGAKECIIDKNYYIMRLHACAFGEKRRKNG